MSQDVHQHITDTIVAAIEAGAGGVELPWHRAGVATSMPLNISSGKPYNGINVLMLWATAEEKGYNSGTWGTYRQWQEKEAQVRKGEKSTTIVFYKELPSRDAAGDDEEEEKRFVARSFRVFNADQVDGYQGCWAEPGKNVQEASADVASCFESEAQPARAVSSAVSALGTSGLEPLAFKRTVTSWPAIAHY